MHTQARAAPADRALKPSLLVHLAQQPSWLAGIGLQIVGFGLVATALGMGSLSLVQAIAPVGLLVALPLGRGSQASISGALIGSERRRRSSDWPWPSSSPTRRRDGTLRRPPDGLSCSSSPGCRRLRCSWWPGVWLTPAVPW